MEKQISKVEVINSQGTKTTEYENLNFAKVDLVAKYMNNTSVIVTYKFIITNNGDVTVDFDIDNRTDVHSFAIQCTSPTKMIYYMGPLFLENNKLRNDFWWYCHVTQYLKTPVESQENLKVRETFRQRAEELYKTRIVPQFQQILNTCPIISGNLVIDDSDLSGMKAGDRYHKALNKHFSNIYTRASMVDFTVFPKTTDALRQAILRPIQPGDYEGPNATLTPAEHEMEIYLCNSFKEVALTDIIAKFSKVPYGWNDACTVHVVNELVRRHKRDYSYSNNPNVDVQTVANRIMSELSKFTVHAATAIPDDVIRSFAEAWKDIFGTMEVFPSMDSTAIFRQCQDKDSERGLPKKRDAYARQYKDLRNYPFSAPVSEAIDTFETWMRLNSRRHADAPSIRPSDFQTVDKSCRRSGEHPIGMLLRKGLEYMKCLLTIVKLVPI